MLICLSHQKMRWFDNGDFWSFACNKEAEEIEQNNNGSLLQCFTILSWHGISDSVGLLMKSYSVNYIQVPSFLKQERYKHYKSCMYRSSILKRPQCKKALHTDRIKCGPTFPLATLDW